MPYLACFHAKLWPRGVISHFLNAENWNLLPKIGIQKLLGCFCILYVITQVNTSFQCIFSHSWNIFLHFWCAFCVFCVQDEIQQTVERSFSHFFWNSTTTLFKHQTPTHKLSKLLKSFASPHTHLEKFFFCVCVCVIHHAENLPDQHKNKSHFVVFSNPKIPLNYLTWRQNIQKVRKWCLVVKVLREDMGDVLFLDVFNQANFKYTQKKLFHLTKKQSLEGRVCVLTPSLRTCSFTQIQKWFQKSTIFLRKIEKNSTYISFFLS